MPIWIPALMLLLLAVAIASFARIYRQHMLGESAKERKIDVTVLDKQSVPVIGAQPGQDDQEYWIYVQPTRGGPKREFMVGIHYYHALNPGDSGTLTYQGLKFLHFALQR
ncbi:RNA polymerase subunit sigma [Photobacterium aquae]|uniref:RNA polymerase subunit sigma n=1 Tax=Photobacterium aquae TaxID=1195763 RepID=A0A0J1H6N4_9GAMM|nr:DUF2500 domain-containing protein [Photobacterium aquae]KLV07379.1 RNA polymerase subunit sigma [Photobacterium aquae]